MALSKDELQKDTTEFFSGNYAITSGNIIPDIPDLKFGKVGKELELAMLFIDIRNSTTIVDAFRRTTAARMYKTFLSGVAKIARSNSGELRSFNGDGVLVVFLGQYKRTQAVKAAMQMSWFCQKLLKPEVESYFKNNKILENSDFEFGIGIDIGTVLVVRGGIRGENNNDLVWVGNATNYAVKLSGLCADGYHVYISENIYKNMAEEAKLGGNPKVEMWEPMTWNAKGGLRVYRSNWTWRID